MSKKKIIAVFTVFILLVTLGFVMAQERTRGPAGGPQRFGPMGGPMGEWFDNLTKAYKQKDMDKIGQLIDQMKQGGRLVIPVGKYPYQELKQVIKQNDGIKEY